MNNRQEFTIALNDLFSSRLDGISNKADKKFRELERDINSVGKTSRHAAISIADIDKRLDALRKVRRLSVDTSSIKAANREIQELEGRKARLEGMGTRGGGGGMGLMRGVGGMAVAGAALYGLGSLASSSMNMAQVNEQNAVSFEVLLGSATKADAMLRNIADFAAKTPFRKLEVTEASQAMLGYGVASDQVIPILGKLGDVSRGNSEVFKRVVENYGKAVSAQRMRTEDINQFAEAGIPMWAELEKITGLAGQSLRKYVENNGISVAQMNQAFDSMTGAGGKFHGMMQKQSQTTTGRVSTLADSFDELKMAAGERAKGGFDKLVDAGTALIGTVKGWIEIPAEQKLIGQRVEMNALVHSVTDYNMTEEQRMSTLQSLQEKYPDYFANIDLEKVKNEELLGILGKVNSEYDRKIAVVSSKGVVDRLEEKQQGLNADISRMKGLQWAKDMYSSTGDSAYMDYIKQNETLGETYVRRFETVANNIGLPNASWFMSESERDRIAISSRESDLEASNRAKIYAQQELQKNMALDNIVKLDEFGQKFTQNATDVINKYFDGSNTKAQEFMTAYETIKGDLSTSGTVYSGWKQDMMANAHHLRGESWESINLRYRGDKSSKINEMAKLLDKEQKDGKTTPGAGLTGGTSTSGLGSGITDVSGDRVMQKNVTINITNLIEGGFTISTTNLQEGAGNAKDIVAQALLDAVNDANYVAQ